jgi:DNA-binding transcriptional MocR family regulator
MIAELLLGSQPEAKAELARLRRHDQKAYTGWKVDGWVRWLEGLRGTYERRMNRMCTIIEDGRFHLRQGTPIKNSESDWAVISKTEMYSFSWPRGGMFLWIKLHFETHPLAYRVSGPVLSRFFWLLLLQKPHLVAVAPGTMFSPTKDIETGQGWQYHRLCFAAVSEEDIEACSERYAHAANLFWGIKTLKELEDIDKEANNIEETEGLVNIGTAMGC